MKPGKKKANKTRCPWCIGDKTYEDYHDFEWGRPVHDDQKLFESLILDGFQAGLSWLTILKKRENFRKAFDNFDAKKIAQYDTKKVSLLMKDAGIVRNRLKIEAAIKNAKAFLVTQKEFGTFDKYIWQFVGGKPKKNSVRGLKDVAARTEESDAMSKDLKMREFSFVGTTICYAFMQAVGMVDDHVVSCHRRR